MSDFGTGKTTLIKTKAKQLLKEGKKVVLISFEDKESTSESLLITSLKLEFQEYGSIVHSLRGSGKQRNEYSKDIEVGPLQSSFAWKMSEDSLVLGIT